ncbi:MAG: hypothetical protein IPG71_12370 [bacterium]|nr:hypothetical protein [bacterium]
MRKIAFLSMLAFVAFMAMSCEEDINDSNGSAKVSGYVYQSRQDMTGVEGVQVIIEGSQNADDPYTGPDRWCSSNEDGYYEGWIFLGSDPETGGYDYVGDCSVQWFYQGIQLDSVSGVTLSPGSHFTMPPLFINP